MLKNKWIAMVLAATMLVAGSTTAFAHHGRGNGYGRHCGSRYNTATTNNTSWYGAQNTTNNTAPADQTNQPADVTPPATYAVCPYENCMATYSHTHNNDNCQYYGHYTGDGHAHHLANTSGCINHC